ncbi:hypothetical protein [Paenibacillus sp. P46E]|uniref:hypothetical protein n=1 Tax=Paenibacillus sp. P46E TaxID=1349436 RepID=UPI000939EB9D|nr:hypothetical protein [Paenibacillus sp. P46E]OKP97731.1 hypothetical protein A3849_13575 [Paenibacillus sp. P46E]
MNLSDKAIEMFESLNKQDIIEDILDFEDFHKTYHISKHKPLPERPELLLGQNGIHYLQMSLYRSRLLLDGLIDSINNNNVLVGVLCTRAHFETSAGVGYLLKNLRGYYNKDISFENLELTLSRLLLGTKTKGGLDDAPDPVNVLTMITAADKLFSELSKLSEPLFRTYYDSLSELCHPNSFGLQLSGGINKVGIVRYRGLNEPYEVDIHTSSLFRVSSAGFKAFYKEARKLLEVNEELPIEIK